MAAELSLGLLRREDLPDLAVDSIMRGLDSPSLGELAGLSAGDLSDAFDLIRAALDELGVSIPSPDERDAALWTVIRAEAHAMVAGRRPPIDSARWIWQVAALEVEEEGDLRVFIGLASEWDDHPSERPRLERAIVSAAQELLARPAPRRWIQLRAPAAGSPLRAHRQGTYEAVNPDDLAVSLRLRTDLARWSSDFSLNAAGFVDRASAELFVATGERLAGRLQDELGGAWHVEYWPEPTRPPGLRLRRRWWH